MPIKDASPLAVVVRCPCGELLLEDLGALLKKLSHRPVIPTSFLCGCGATIMVGVIDISDQDLSKFHKNPEAPCQD